MFILASASARRQMLLERFPHPFSIEPASMEESSFGGTAACVVSGLAFEKAREVWSHHPEEVVVGVDTVVVHEGRVLGKPKDAEEAKEMLRTLSGSTHEVLTGYAIIGPKHRMVNVVTTKVTFRELTDEEIFAYVETKEPMDKAGSYGIQGLGSLFVEGIEGDYEAVVGLPTSALAQDLKESFGIDLLKGV